ncbi:hypothetical protein CJ030_MR7G021964 [Morella rubra]|uniref:Uncharacterized protein n=1 Tax=Morella rubra TaxID=262757 RepID=A0A6A1UZJ1_9ROSI|nr:hypothetical protein CJ030_MR7G021964 [Morella rubra]
MVSKTWTPSNSGANVGLLCCCCGCRFGLLTCWGLVEFPSLSIGFGFGFGSLAGPIDSLTFWPSDSARSASTVLNIDIMVAKSDNDYRKNCAESSRFRILARNCEVLTANREPWCTSSLVHEEGRARERRYLEWEAESWS